ncbi:Pantothenate kinase [Mycena venus]|uniref:inorganic diphosphatase n=1 Tax=Mycena venus TaxID=2733690 RepID=A0A8H6XW51_9AGAR|nr:Pantothenate kinase [Mycena venus]
MPPAEVSNYTPRCAGAANTPEHRVYVSYNGHVVSALHDIPLLPMPSSNESDDDTKELILNMIVEAPRWTNAQMTIAPSEAFAPVKQVMRRGRRLAYVRNTFPHRGYIWNYGALPQTWSDGGPLHACELGERVAQVGDVRRVRVLGVLAPRDEGVLRWTLLVIDTADPLAARLNTIADVERECPGLISATKEWLSDTIFFMPGCTNSLPVRLRTPLELGGEAKGVGFTRKILRTAHEDWRNIVTGSASSALVDL